MPLWQPLSKWLMEGEYLRRVRVPVAINFISDPAGVPALANCAEKAVVQGLGWFRLDCGKYLAHLASPFDLPRLKKIAPILEKMRKELIDYRASDPASANDFLRKMDGFNAQVAALSMCGADVACWTGKLEAKVADVRDQAVWQLAHAAGAGNDKALDALLTKVGADDFGLRNTVLDALPKVCDKRCLGAIDAVRTKEKGKTRYKGFRDRMTFVRTQIANKG